MDLLSLTATNRTQVVSKTLAASSMSFAMISSWVPTNARYMRSCSPICDSLINNNLRCHFQAMLPAPESDKGCLIDSSCISCRCSLQARKILHLGKPYTLLRCFNALLRFTEGLLNKIDAKSGTSGTTMSEEEVVTEARRRWRDGTSSFSLMFHTEFY